MRPAAADIPERNLFDRWASEEFFLATRAREPRRGEAVLSLVPDLVVEVEDQRAVVLHLGWEESSRSRSNENFSVLPKNCVMFFGANIEATSKNQRR